jgi:hypothetical protein
MKEAGNARNPSSLERSELGAKASASSSPTNPPPKNKVNRIRMDATEDEGLSFIVSPGCA